mmetsp:Transcript_13871/g.18116  ORF Transcript_13871/g.18116 Transcript_13871/m.18116 type:complete len:117 (+) Transcript_13871:439-789(+)
MYTILRLTWRSTQEAHRVCCEGQGDEKTARKILNSTQHEDKKPGPNIKSVVWLNAVRLPNNQQRNQLLGGCIGTNEMLVFIFAPFGFLSYISASGPALLYLHTIFKLHIVFQYIFY